ncbi:sensor histidine kinase [Ohtaekwangia kribbensis]|jgi:two-component system LytT family sensor kinase|uniref:Sensor histidine kinase n=1 Tax=Ohtaekwangia kribbensis TaxID=688913 RepID=A0ABW3K3Z0_9BACT
MTAYFAFVIMVYINIYVLVPYFFFRNRYGLYLALLVMLVILGLQAMGYVLNTHLVDYRIVRPTQIQGVYEGTVISISIILVTTMVKLLQRWTKDNDRIAELNNLTLRMELNELKNQINPHFLFNMLNNVKALIRTDPEKASFVIVKLSEFLRFQLYENNEDKTLLTSEINFLSNFIGLEKIRRDNLSVSLQSNTDQRVLSSVFVPPNLFTTFVENAIKHSVDLTDTETYIHINIMVENQKLYFTCSNSVSHEYRVADKKNSGLGLVNIKRRLELLYGDSYSLDINAAEHKYTVTLIIPI